MSGKACFVPNLHTTDRERAAAANTIAEPHGYAYGGVLERRGGQKSKTVQPCAK